MISISREQVNALRRAGMLKEGAERNYQIASKRKRRGGKTYFLAEEFDQMAYLGLYDQAFLEGSGNFNKVSFLEQWIRDRKLKRISFYQLKELQKKYNAFRVQEEGQSVQSAEAYIFNGAVYMRTIPYLLKEITNIPFKRPAVGATA